MCFHKRLLFRCSHYLWLGVTRPCAAEEAFDAGKTDVGCAVRWSHGFDTVRVQAECPSCCATKGGDELKLGVLKEGIAVLKEHLRMIKGVENIKVEDWLHPEWVKPKEEGEEGEGEGEVVAEGEDVIAETETDKSSPVTIDESVLAAVVFDDCGLDEVMEEVSYDPRHRPLKLVQMARDAKA